MAKDLNTYLEELQAVMTTAGADPALVQDALFDAEEYLRTEMAERYESEPASTEEYRARFATVSDGYGSPEEVAAAYVAQTAGGDGPEVGAPTSAAATAVPEPPPAPPAPTTTTPSAAQPAGAGQTATGAGGAAGAAAGTAGATGAAQAAQPSALRQVFGVVIDPAVYKALLYMLLSLGTGIAYFTIVVTGVSTAGGMLILIIGVPLFLLVLGLVRGLALIEGRLVEALLGTRMPRRERADLPEAGWMKRIVFWLKDGRTWASMGYMILMLPLGVAYFTIAVAGLSAGVGLIGSPFGNWAREHVFTWRGTEYVFGLPLWASPLAVIAGFALLLLWLHLIRWIGRGHAAFAKHMLVRLAQ